MSVFGSGTSDSLEPRIATLENRVDGLVLTVGDNATAGQAALDGEAMARHSADQALDDAIVAERDARIGGDQANADLIAELILRVAAIEAGGGGSPGSGSYTPSLIFSDTRNSGYLTFTILEDI